jgi:hypothetical protein
MGMPNIPDIKPDIDLCKKDVVNLLLSSIALEEMGLAHIINAEGEKLQAVIKNSPCSGDLFAVDESVQDTLRDVIRKEVLLDLKFDNVLRYAKLGERDKGE